MEDYKNYALAILLSIAVFFLWNYYVIAPKNKAYNDYQQKVRESKKSVTDAHKEQNQDITKIIPNSNTIADSNSAGLDSKIINGTIISREEAINEDDRVKLENSSIIGSINLRGAKFDDIVLKNYRETISEDSKNIILFSPLLSSKSYFASFSYLSGTNNIKAPGLETLWKLVSGNKLTKESPITLQYDNGEGLIFQQKISIDDEYMIFVKSSVFNKGAKSISISPYGSILRGYTPKTAGFYVLHEGITGVFGKDPGLTEVTYKDLKKEKYYEYQAKNGWVGFSDKYWAAAILSPKDRNATYRFKHRLVANRDVYLVDNKLDQVQIKPGDKATNNFRLFAGAKVVSKINSYQESQDILGFDYLVDWGWFYFITKPLFKLISFFEKLLGNFGLAILAATVIVKMLFFPLANKSYASMSKMKKLQPRVKDISEIYKEDKMKQREEIMKLYKEEKVNPLSGCLPMILQIPVFFALYKVLLITIDMRHAPFYLWVKDLSAQDTTNLFNFFGLLPFQPSPLFHIGILPILMGITMFLQMRLNPEPTDPVQKVVFTWMPLFFTYLLAAFPAGLILYWTWNNILSLTQQYIIMRKNGVEVNLWKNTLTSLGLKKRVNEKELDDNQSKG